MKLKVRLLNKMAHIGLNIIRSVIYIYIYPIYHKIYVKNLKNKSKIEVVFFAMNIAMWRYQKLYEYLSLNKRFNTHIILSPAIAYSKEQQLNDLNKLRSFFDANEIKYIDYDLNNNNKIYDVKKEINPDILFYPQPYEKTLNIKHDYTNFKNKLICYYPYSFWIGKDDWGYNLPFHNIAWKLYYANIINYEEAQKSSYNKGKNVVVVGYPNTDDYLQTTINHNVWKKQDKEKKKVIYAPHFTIDPKRSIYLQSSFLENGEAMLEIAKLFKDDIQFAFKPHPKLKTELYLNKNWGEKKTNEYYSEWEELSNCQHEEGSYTDLFMTSDALIHDCGSFIVEYLYTRKPVLYISHDINNYLNGLNDLGKNALSVHYIGKGEKDIINFIKEVVLNCNDSLKENRNIFFNKYLLPPKGKSVVDNTLNDLLKSLKING